MRYIDDLISDRRARALLLITLIGLLAAIRLMTLGTYPLMDTTEARYGEIARIMLDTGNWVTPQEWPGRPFWAKPPLYAWLSAASMAMLGVNEFAVRLPSLLLSIGTALLAFLWARGIARVSERAWPGDTGLLAVAVLASSILFYVSAGAVMTDPALALCITWMLLAFHRCVIDGERAFVWRYGFFIAAGIGMLAKGPVIAVYAGLPIIAFAIWRRDVASIWSRLPWVWGSLLFLAVCVPWYVAAEMRTPGFVEYFLLGEHVMRFIKPGWKGDLYGNAHREPLGYIWLFAASSIGLWTLVLIATFFTRKRSAKPLQPMTASTQWLLCCVLAPLLFFTAARNIIWTYVLPMLAPVAVLLADIIDARLKDSAPWRRVAVLAALASSMLLTFLWIDFAPRHASERSSQRLVANWRLAAQQNPGRLLYWGKRPQHSLRFYSRNAAQVIDPKQSLASPSGRDYVVLDSEDIAAFKRWLDGQTSCGKTEILASTKDMSLLEVEPGRADCAKK
jgi:4-amino-4-deoxy-L-arabinose transferase-like glycosyltransferase